MVMIITLMVMIMMMMTKIKDSGRMIAGWAHSSSAAAVKSLIFLSSSPPSVMWYFVFCVLLYVFCVLYFVLRSVFCIKGYLCFVTCMARFCTFCIVKRTFDSTTLPYRGAVIYTRGRWTVHCETNLGFCKYSVVQKILPSPLANIFCKYFVFKKMRQKTQLWWKEWIKLFVPAQVCWKKFSKLYVAKEYLFISALSWSLAALVSNGKESGNWIKMVMIPVYLGNPLSLKTNPSPLLPLIYAGPPGLVKREEEIMHTCHDTGSQCLPPTPLLPILENIQEYLIISKNI